MVQQRGTLAGIAGDQVIATTDGTHVFHRTHGNHIGVVRRSHDGPVSIGVLRVVPSFVASRNDYDDTALPCALNSLTQWIQAVRFVYRPPQTQIYDLDVICLYQTDSTITRTDNRTIRPVAFCIQDAQVDDVRVWRDTDESARTAGTRRHGAVPGQNPGDMGSVPIIVICIFVIWQRSRQKARAVYDPRRTALHSGIQVGTPL